MSDPTLNAAKSKVASLELGIADPMQLFNFMDPAPFHERDLDPEVVDYIVAWAQEVAPDTPLELVVTIKQATATEHSAGMISDAMHSSFQRRALAKQRALKKLLREGRISLVIGVIFLAAAIFISDFIGGLVSNENYAWLVQESVVIGGWVALWHPINIFLYDWWPIHSEQRLFERLSRMPVRLVHPSGS